MISDFLPPAITVTTGVGVGRQGKQPTTGCVCPRSKSVIAGVSPGSDPDTSATFPRNLRAPELRGLALVRICSVE